MILTKRKLLLSALAAPALILPAKAQIFVPPINLVKQPAGGGGPQSLVLASASSQELTRTYGSAPTDGKKFTFACWIKRTTVQNAYTWFVDGGPWGGGSSTSVFGFRDNNTLQSFKLDSAGTITTNINAVQSITDTTTWHHVGCTVDTTVPSMKLYLDGTECTYSFGDAPELNEDWHMTTNGILAEIGVSLNAKLAYMYYIDGQIKTMSNFVTGTPGSPATYAGTFGTNGFFLNFSASDGADSSGNGNNWTPVNGPTFSADVPT